MKCKKLFVGLSILLCIMMLNTGGAYGKDLSKIITITYSDGTEQRIPLAKSLRITKIEFSSAAVSSTPISAEEKTAGIKIKSVNQTKDEKDFTQNTLLPLFQGLGFKNVRFKHGKREYGKDIIFQRITELGDFEYWAVQVKYGNVSGSGTSKGSHKIDPLIYQIDDAFEMPFDNLDSGKKEKISKLVIAVSGKFSENATEKIIEKVKGHAAKNNVLFIDGTKIDDLIKSLQ